MPEVALDSKSPKTPRRLKTGGEPLRQVHFHSPGSNTSSGGIKPTTSTSTSTPTATSAPFSSTTVPSGEGIAASDSASSSNQPESFPQLGAPPHSSLGAGQWHTSIDPTQSVKLPGQPFAGTFAPGFTSTPPLAHLFAPRPQLVNNTVCSPFPPPQLSAPITYIGLQSQHQQYPSFTTMADYQNAAPMPTGINFQPPVPDSTFGPIPHVYVPRFDGSYMPAAVQVGLPSVQFVSAPAAYSTTVVMPKTLLLQQPTVAGVPVAHPSYVVAQQPAVVPQPLFGQQPVMIGGHPAAAAAAIPVQQVHAVPAMGMSGIGGVPVIAGNAGQIPDVSGLGRTPAEETVRQLQFAHANKLFEPQEFKPSDDDPSRFYYVREVDGNWTQRNRFTIDHLGDCRWYVTDEGWFYAVRMPN
ncbi:hypothetical protein TARUN_8161 [Trichoderma arundinaceum]|uniref:Uncharacterized protein n=1 Tax=Trichoderma arundinaceum TaxID=490622 RepID=A0A395NDA4_TRIAR|nr:hypothetical protein TARUN_8161 [Trichoderma arundinaceum]